MNNEQILANAPEWANEYACSKSYSFTHKGPTRSLQDIETIVAQGKELEQLKAAHQKMLHEVANQYDGNDSTEWSIGANHVFKLFAKWVHNNTPPEGE